jgi:uncharacterized protein (DUF4213/DUF364 family)
MWASYRRLLEGVPPQREVAECIVGLIWTLVRTTDGDAGLSLTFRQGLDESNLPGAIAGSDLRAIASRLTSWNYYEAAIGAAAVNSVYNTRAHVERITGLPLAELIVSGSGVFENLSKRFSGGRVAVIGHFPSVDVLASRCRLVVLERRPELGDLPDPACEDLLPEQDLVCITGASATNKTLPRLLALSRNAYTVLVGPSTLSAPSGSTSGWTCSLAQ